MLCNMMQEFVIIPVKALHFTQCCTMTCNILENSGSPPVKYISWCAQHREWVFSSSIYCSRGYKAKQKFYSNYQVNFLSWECSYINKRVFYLSVVTKPEKSRNIYLRLLDEKIIVLQARGSFHPGRWPANSLVVHLWENHRTQGPAGHQFVWFTYRFPGEHSRSLLYSFISSQHFHLEHHQRVRDYTYPELPETSPTKKFLVARDYI